MLKPYRLEYSPEESDYKNVFTLDQILFLIIVRVVCLS